MEVVGAEFIPARCKMIEYRTAKNEDIGTLKSIWQLTFGDPKKFIDFYFANRFNPNNTLLLLKEQKIVSMLTRIPVKLATPHEGYEGVMFYAIATHPGYQKQGLATRLMEFANGELKKEGKDFSIIVPANPGLFQFYLRQGYRTGFEIRQTVLNAEETTNINDCFQCDILSITPPIYNQKRQELLKDRNHINYEEIEVAYQQKLSRFSGADLYMLLCHPECQRRNSETLKTLDSSTSSQNDKQKNYHSWADTDSPLRTVQGLMAVERIDNQRIIIKECLLPEECLPSAIKELSLLLPANEYIVRTPGFLGESFGGSTKPFAAIKKIGEKELLKGQAGYLGLAFD